MGLNYGDIFTKVVGGAGIGALISQSFGGGGCGIGSKPFNTQISILSGAYKDGFMGVVDENVKSSTTPTRYPVETAQQVMSDHVHVNPREIEFSILVSMTHYFSPQQVYGFLRTMQEGRTPTTIVSNLHVLPSMIITDVDGTIDNTSHKAIINIKAVEVRISGGGSGGSGGQGCSNSAPADASNCTTMSSGRVNHVETSCYGSNNGCWSS